MSWKAVLAYFCIGISKFRYKVIKIKEGGMPIYEYFCLNCKHKFELMRPMSQASNPALCPSCGNSVERIFSTFSASSKSSEGEFSLGGSSCSSCLSTTCNSCPLSRRKNA
ncbi:MAG: hypothetical protein CO031_01390 [Candidatus Nealsonbacteria bacterium CG_4_9_14_0_2_um_filter_37_38]|uniref:Putative regulatory protein FmdB zinc ribbon domain-containing protein n=1 Tax=Candidatus Nealsonbacteria bacterium CG_4_10_14_0_8_um_filter_37_14 TaxID=1974684 RepID=A0A2M7R775_9BACT|nr:MAG: hypothetical protein COV63_01045 [Candidatus Nealsonbacteria bacterium CG11_big_fil_rev_8_21_14_0_20_37_68]PIW92328.1 MAG: hypothetical protein COZ89_00515 [Candidatus Nealsonbacteria bacterium CG_4_8_14_3_um_filter_37_23]PIY89252.1 MAG: hypothetical protein COY73_01355 [Candidatus Nealsonbacteria bacterium CG_4_10_14_0_8_um_filter_37_14]PJC51687.1 MAG: hypothetical protein CO031_01390 [Candidatus Nealsonbacteria bacterium CG_4_9_14_0_2_um_filter_37_38]